MSPLEGMCVVCLVVPAPCSNELVRELAAKGRLKLNDHPLASMRVTTKSMV